MHPLHVHVPYHLFSRYLEFIRTRRFDLEIYFDAGSLDAITPEHAKRMRHMLYYGPSLSFHAPFMDLSPGAVDSEVKRVTLKRFSQILDIAEIVRPKCIVFHSGYEKWKYALDSALWLEQSLATWQFLNKRAEDIGVKIAIENIFEDEPDNLSALMRAMDSQNFGICFDTGHWNLFSQSPLDHWLDQLKDHIVELHLHDNDKSADQHLPPGDGSFDFSLLFSLLGDKECIHTIEAHSPEHVLKSIESLGALLQPRGIKGDRPCF